MGLGYLGEQSIKNWILFQDPLSIVSRSFVHICICLGVVFRCKILPQPKKKKLGGVETHGLTFHGSLEVPGRGGLGRCHDRVGLAASQPQPLTQGSIRKETRCSMSMHFQTRLQIIVHSSFSRLVWSWTPLGNRQTKGPGWECHGCSWFIGEGSSCQSLIPSVSSAIVTS